MPLFDFRCKKCGTIFETLLRKSEQVSCSCGSEDVEKFMPNSFAVTFTNPTDTSKMDSFSYRAGMNMEKAKEERRVAQKRDHMGLNPYRVRDFKPEQEHF